MVPIVQLGLRAHNERMSITASVTATLWFQSRQYYGYNDKQVVQQLRQEGYPVDDEDLKYIWPTRHAHINVYGQYHFDKKRLRKKHPLRVLRNPNS